MTPKEQFRELFDFANQTEDKKNAERIRREGILEIARMANTLSYLNFRAAISATEDERNAWTARRETTQAQIAAINERIKPKNEKTD
ncbi:MAG: hypothetical protein IPP15_15970 [Saprospiraceae bacterium]|uniref:Uncharacterized protein n=1 Tax=Candidatus Opimibacter skivensis TaxID=2982028 RepID=A0A9D7SZW3_9BACT|nr:hypothetical protein [Candidatus Opimibacter skivensis]